MMVEHLKYLWSKFVVGLITIPLEAQSRGEMFDWNYKFTCLFNDYLLNEKTSTNVNCPCSSFDEYLCLKISSPRGGKDALMVH